MSRYQKGNQELWTGRKSDRQLYLHEKVTCIDMEKQDIPKNAITLLGYSCDEGVRRNQGRIGAKQGPDAIRKSFSKMPNHLSTKTNIIDAGTIICSDEHMDVAQRELSEKVTDVFKKASFPILLGGGHDIAYAHYLGIKKHFGKNKTIGIINFDAHFDLRSNENGNNSGTPFFQIEKECKTKDIPFKYIVLGIRKDANDKELFETAAKYRVQFIENDCFHLNHLAEIENTIGKFIAQVDVVYVTIDLDGFSSAYAPGVSAASPMGFSPEIVLKCLQCIIDSKKLVSLDIAELNPTYDVDGQTAKLASSLLHFIIHRL